MQSPFFLSTNSSQGVPHNSYKTLINLFDQEIYQSIVDGEYTQAEDTLEKVFNIIHSTDYSHDPLSHYLHQQLYHYNYACISQKTWKTEECSEHLSRAGEFVMKRLAVTGSKWMQLALAVEHIQVQLQYCAVLSQQGNHESALKIAENIILEQKRIYNDSLKICQWEIKNRRAEKNLIDFNRVILEKAREMLLVLSQIQTARQVIQQCAEKYNSLSQDMYYWKNSPQNNEKMMRRKLNSESVPLLSGSRNMLGVKEKPKGEEWVSTFNIGSVMMIKPKRSRDVREASIESVFSFKKLMQQVFYTSITYFTIATETRFKDIDKDMKGLKQTQKTIKLKDHPSIKICKTFHLKAIELVAKFVPTSTHYINHLILSFNKNYKSNMDAINEENSFALSDVFEPKKSRKRIETVLNVQEQEEEEERYIQEFQKRARSITGSKNFVSKKSKPKAVRSNRVYSVNSKSSSQGNAPSKISEYNPPSYDKKQIKTFTFKFVDEVKMKSPKPRKSKPKSKSKFKNQLRF